MEVLILNTSLETVKNLDVFESFIWTERFSAYGDFELYLPIEPDVFDYIKQGYYVIIKDSKRAMIIETISVESDVEDGARLAVSGRSLESILERRIVWKQTTLSGSLQTGIQKLLNENIISPSDSTRKISEFYFLASTNSAITALTATAQFTGDNLYEAIKKLCDAFDIGFRVTLGTVSGADKFIFELYTGDDRSYEQITNPYVIFSPGYENLLNSNYMESEKNLKTVALVAGEGEGSARKTATVAASGGAKTGLDRREMFSDARDISQTVDDVTISDAEYTKQLTQRGTEDLTEHVSVKSFEAEAETNDTIYVCGVDYFIGDIVQLANEYGHTARSRITEIIRSESDSGYSVYPTFTSIE